MTFKELHDQALNLPDADRAALAADLLSSLPAMLAEEDDGIAEALRRSKDLDENPAQSVSWSDIKNNLGR